MVTYLEKLDVLTEGKYKKGFDRAIARYGYFANEIGEETWKVLFNKNQRKVFKGERG